MSGRQITRENHNKHVCQGRRKIGAEFPFSNHPYHCPFSQTPHQHLLGVGEFAEDLVQMTPFHIQLINFDIFIPNKQANIFNDGASRREHQHKGTVAPYGFNPINPLN